MLFSYRSQVTTIADKKKNNSHIVLYIMPTHLSVLFHWLVWVSLTSTESEPDIVKILTENCYREKNILSVFRAMDKRGKVSEETVVLRLRGVYVE